MDEVGRRPDIDKIILNAEDNINSEISYLYASVMTVYEHIFEDSVNVEWCEENVDELISEISVNYDTLITLNELGVTDYYDITYLMYLAALIGENELDKEDLWQFVGNYYTEIFIKAPDIFDYVSNEVSVIYNYEDDYIKREGQLWQELKKCFDHWYLGDEGYMKLYNEEPLMQKGKKGFK